MPASKRASKRKWSPFQGGSTLGAASATPGAASTSAAPSHSQDTTSLPLLSQSGFDDPDRPPPPPAPTQAELDGPDTWRGPGNSKLIPRPPQELLNALLQIGAEGTPFAGVRVPDPGSGVANWLAQMARHYGPPTPPPPSPAQQDIQTLLSQENVSKAAYPPLPNAGLRTPPYDQIPPAGKVVRSARRHPSPCEIPIPRLSCPPVHHGRQDHSSTSGGGSSTSGGSGVSDRGSRGVGDSPISGSRAPIWSTHPFAITGGGPQSTATGTGNQGERGSRTSTNTADATTTTTTATTTYTGTTTKPPPPTTTTTATTTTTTTLTTLWGRSVFIRR